jgi:hypothetical protein
LLSEEKYFFGLIRRGASSWKKFAAQFITSQRLCYVFVSQKFTFITAAHSREHKNLARK